MEELTEELKLKYLNDPDGNPSAVVIPFEEWKSHLAEYLRLKQLDEFKNDLREGFESVRAMMSGEEEKITLEEFLNEC